jgi:hypothetical protein
MTHDDSTPSEMGKAVSEVEQQTVLTLLARIEQHLARLADAVESYTADSGVNFRKDLGPSRELPMPKRR